MSLLVLRSGQERARLAQAGAVFAVAVFAAGCGNGYRPVITPINPTGPAAQPNSLVAVVSSTGPTTPGVATIIDYSGDTIVAQATIGPGPLSFSADETGSNGYTVNSDGTLTNFPVSSQLQTRNVQFTTLPTTANVVNLFRPPADCGHRISMATLPTCLAVFRPPSSWPFRWRPRQSRWWDP